ncbi:MAG: hypothetical protein JWO81_1882 [Alphaproteobacteria bacterium]|nr:hypothetical protein [Alphaproteobacteria bacterium]
MIISDKSHAKSLPAIEHEQMRSAPHCAALSGRQGGPAQSKLIVL